MIFNKKYVADCPSGMLNYLMVGKKAFIYGTENVHFQTGMRDCEARGLRVSSFETREEFDAIQGKGDALPHSFLFFPCNGEKQTHFYVYFITAAGKKVWTGINSNRNTETCIGTQCDGVASWWYHKKSVFTSGDIPDKLVRFSVLCTHIFHAAFL